MRMDKIKILTLAILLASSNAQAMQLPRFNKIEKVNSYFNWLTQHTNIIAEQAMDETATSRQDLSDRYNQVDEKKYQTIDRNPLSKERYVSSSEISDGEIIDPYLNFDFADPAFENSERCKGDVLTTRFAAKRMHWIAKCSLGQKPNPNWAQIELFLLLDGKKMLIEEHYYSDTEDRKQILYFSFVETYKQNSGETQLRGRWLAPISSEENCISPQFFEVVVCKSKLD